MDINERDRLAGAIAAIRPDWAGSGVDRHKSIRTWLTEHAMEWTYRDAIVRMLLCAIEPTTVTPARALTDGPWLAALRHLAGNASTDQPVTTQDRGADCDLCGIPESMHAGVRIQLDRDGQHLDPHDWTSLQAHSIASPEQIARIRLEVVK